MTSMLFLNIPLIFISSLGILFNGYVVTAVLLTRQVSTANNILLLHLGTIDLVLGILFLTFSVPNGYGVKHDGGYWMSEGFWCSLHGFLHTLLHPLALWTVCGLNCDRYYAIAAPLHYAHIVNAKKVLFGLGTGWILSLLLCLPPLFAVAPYGYVHALGACAPNFLISDGSAAGTFWYSVLYTAFTLLLPTTLIVCCNLKILMIARYHRHRIASAIYEVTLSAQVTITHQRNPFFVPTVTAPSNGGPPASSKFRGRSAICSVLQLVGSLATLYIPYYTLIVWESVNGSFLLLKPNRSSIAIHPQFFTVSLVLLVCSPTVNGFLYGVKSKNLRKTFKNYWRKKQTKSEVHQEIQARTPSTCGSRRPSLTPLGFLARPAAPSTLQRRLSEAFLDHRSLNASPQKHKIKRITTELSWRPASASSLHFLSAKNGTSGSSIKQTASCNTLQVPNDAEIATIAEKPASAPAASRAGANAGLVFKFFRGEEVRSPRITITRTYSDESSDNSRKETIISRKHSSSSSALIERNWRLEAEYKRALLAAPSVNNGVLDSGESSSDLSDESGKIFMALDSQKITSKDEEILLSWNRRNNFVGQDHHDEKKNITDFNNKKRMKIVQSHDN